MGNMILHVQTVYIKTQTLIVLELLIFISILLVQLLQISITSLQGSHERIVLDLVNLLVQYLPTWQCKIQHIACSEVAMNYITKLFFPTKYFFFCQVYRLIRSHVFAMFYAQTVRQWASPRTCKRYDHYPINSKRSQMLCTYTNRAQLTSSLVLLPMQ